jgi:flagellar biosynthesis chaperone FliJ
MNSYRLGLLLDLILVLCLCVLPPSDQAPKPTVWDEIAGPYVFSITEWELGNFLDKWGYSFEQFFIPGKLSEQESVKRVEDYLSLAQNASSMEDTVNRYKAEGNTSEADLKSLETQLAQLKRQRNSLEDQVEAIIEGQISSILTDAGLAKSIKLVGRANLLFPPVDFEFEEEPNVLIISPRDKIELTKTILLRPDLSLEQIEGIENKVQGIDMSGLVERVGGVATYPSIIPQDVSLQYLLSTVAHEWLHQYFYFHPLGRNYWANYDMTSINETAADIGGDEIGLLVYRRYYEQASDDAASRGAASQPAFDFNKEMRQIRLTVDQYLAQGQVEEAKRYMEQMREYLAQNGYYIRKLNQAYFAFHGTYSDTPGSVSPIGGYLAELRQGSPSLGGFIKTVSGVSSYEELLRMIGQ